MSNGLSGIGPLPNRFMLLAERPGPEDWDEFKAFSGYAANEIFARIWKVLRLNKEDIYCTYLFNRFTGMEFDPAQLSTQWHRVQGEILRCRPSVIAVVGYYGARFLLPELRGLNGDFFHGKAFPYRYGKLQPRTATIVPLAHATSALKQPDRYQNQLTRDLECVRDCLRDDYTHHRVDRPTVYQVGLASFGKPGQTLGADTEGSVAAPECITIARGEGPRERPSPYVACIETYENGHAVPFTRASLEHAAAVIFHYAIHDLKVLRTLGITHIRKVHDTMIGAYLLDLPQSLKLLAWRELGYVMSEYADLVDPLDAALVKDTLTRKARIWQEEHEALQRRAVKRATKRAPLNKKTGAPKVTKKAITEQYKALCARHPQLPPMKTVNAILRMIDRSDAAHATDTEAEP